MDAEGAGNLGQVFLPGFARVETHRRRSFARNAGFTVSLTGAGTQTTGVVRCDQPRPLDLAARNGRELESVPQHVLDDVLAKLATRST